ncbi:MAG: formylglycine-generating enzyme family protein [Candidatus Hydrogenedentes bacterium]|nr:formylglycine-generating enzyme family protein [Candidatus Hydrogenedentota bacterium]
MKQVAHNIFACTVCAVMSGCASVGDGVASDRGDVSFRGTTAGDESTVNGVALCWCPAGLFVMGSPVDEPERRPGEDQIAVRLSRGFWIGKYEVTQGEWKRVLGTLPPVLDEGAGDRFPIYNVNFAEAESFCVKLTEQARAAGALPEGWEFRLPTEAQWEYACRARTTTATPFGDSLSSHQANFLGEFPYNGAAVGPALNTTCEVGRYPANAWNIHDMPGNVFEWCRDWYHFRLPGGTDPDLHDVLGTASEQGTYSRARRGGCWADQGWPCRSAFRLRFEPERSHSHIGFRVVAVEVKKN